jgi:DNA topoisomerase-1
VKKEKKSLVPTELGFTVNDIMIEYFTDIVDVKFTAAMEDKLDDVESKGEDWKRLIEEFYGPFSEELSKADKAIERVEIPDRPTGEVCELCGRPMVIKTGRFGEFIACSGYPECKNTKPIVKPTGVKCPQCGKEIVEKRSRKGKIFFGCSGYPDCKVSFWYRPVDKKCPKCGSLLMERKGRGTTLVCSNDECGYKE